MKKINKRVYTPGETRTVAVPAERMSDKIRSATNDDFPRLGSASFALPTMISEGGLGGIAVVGEGTGMSVCGELQEFLRSLFGGKKRRRKTLQVRYCIYVVAVKILL